MSLPVVGFALSGSFCTYDQVYAVLRKLALDYTVIPIMSQHSASIDSRSATRWILKTSWKASAEDG